MNESESLSLEESQKSFTESLDEHFVEEISIENFDVVDKGHGVEMEQNSDTYDVNSFNQTDEESKKKSMEEQTDGIKSDDENTLDEDVSTNDHKNQLDLFLKAFQESNEFDTKLQLAIDFMEASLGLGGSPHFKNFWEARRLALPLFKDNVSPMLRNVLWTKYSELSKEARRLKEILDEQSAFAVEQIDMAIKALEDDINQYEEQVEKSSLNENLPFPQFLKDKESFYYQMQKQLNILNTQASRINGLRKELLKTEMRIRQKNKFFQRLSAAGDLVFPKRKELIKQISQEFMEDVERFIQTSFSEHGFGDSLFVLREEIKSLQGLAKVLTLNTNSFTQTRMRLSNCWDQIKAEEKDRKKERSQQKVFYKQNADIIRKSIKELDETVETGIESNPNAWQNSLQDLVSKMRNIELGRDDIKELRDELHEVRKKIQDKSKREENARLEQEEEKKKQKRAKFEAFKNQINTLVKQSDQFEAENLVNEREALLIQLQESTLTKIEKQELERLMKPLRDIINEKKEQALLNLSEDDRESLTQLQEVLKQRKERRQEVKNQIEVLRKASGSSSLDFEKAMQFTTQVNEEKERLEKMNQSVDEVEKKISQLKSKLKGK
jgi:hypothetical protein